MHQHRPCRVRLATCALFLMLMALPGTLRAAFSVDPTDNALALWLDASAVGSVRTGTIGTWNNNPAGLTTAGNGDPVAMWADQRTPGGGNLANTVPNNVFYNANSTGPDSTKRPTYVAQGLFMGLWQPVIRFDGVNDRLITWDGAMPVLKDEHTIFVVGNGRRTSNGQSDNYLNYTRYGSLVQVQTSVYKDASGRHFRMNEPGVDTFNSAVSAALDLPVLLTQRRTHVSTNYVTEGFLNGGAWLSVSVADTNVVNATGNYMGFQLGQLGPAAQFLTGDIAEVIVFNRALTNLERADVEAYLQTKWFPEPGMGFSLALAGALTLCRRRRGRGRARG